MKKALGLIVSISLMVSIMAGCTQSPSENADTGSLVTPETTTSEATTPKTNTPISNDESELAEWPRTYLDASGTEVVLEEKPQKIALLFFHHFEAALALDAQLYAAATLEAYNGWESLRPYAEKRELIDLGGTREPNLEKLVEIEPDLIIAAAGVHDSMLENLQKIAPTVVVSRADNFGTWQGTLLEYGKILGEEELAEKRTSDLENLIVENRETLSVYSDKTVALIRPLEKEVNYWIPDFLYNSEGGLGLTSAFPKPDSVSAGGTISYEAFADADPDYIFLYEDALDESDEAMWATLEEDTVWNSLSAVKNGHVYILDRSVFSGGPLAMEMGIRIISESILSAE